MWNKERKSICLCGTSLKPSQMMCSLHQETFFFFEEGKKANRIFFFWEREFDWGGIDSYSTTHDMMNQSSQKTKRVPSPPITKHCDSQRWVLQPHHDFHWSV